jgi:hypothetical protein
MRPGAKSVAATTKGTRGILATKLQVIANRAVADSHTAKLFGLDGHSEGSTKKPGERGEYPSCSPSDPNLFAHNKNDPKRRSQFYLVPACWSRDRPGGTNRLWIRCMATGPSPIQV